MKATDKAKELIEKYFTLASSAKGGKESNAKQCAEICVKEIMNQPIPLGLEQMQYWQEVLNEIKTQ